MNISSSHTSKTPSLRCSSTLGSKERLGRRLCMVIMYNYDSIAESSRQRCFPLLKSEVNSLFAERQRRVHYVGGNSTSPQNLLAAAARLRYFGSPPPTLFAHVLNVRMFFTLSPLAIMDGKNKFTHSFERPW